MRALTAGETMALLDPVAGEKIQPSTLFGLRVAGSESNFAIALRRLGVEVAWVSRVGMDPFGDAVVQALQGERVDVSNVRRDGKAPTGVFFKERSDGRTSVYYYRRGSAACRLRAGDIPHGALDGVALVYLTGITMALSRTARQLVIDLAGRARDRGITVVFDPNYRSALWRSPKDAERTQREVMPSVDWYLCGSEEGNTLFGTADPDALFDAIATAGALHASVRVGGGGALIQSSSGLVQVPPARVEAVVDEVGAGDGFAAGFAFGLMNALNPEECARIGNLVAAAALRGTGDWETYPRYSEIADSIQLVAPAI